MLPISRRNGSRISDFIFHDGNCYDDHATQIQGNVQEQPIEFGLLNQQNVLNDMFNQIC